jgi:hypothetical protein
MFAFLSADLPIIARIAASTTGLPGLVASFAAVAVAAGELAAGVPSANTERELDKANRMGEIRRTFFTLVK